MKTWIYIFFLTIPFLSFSQQTAIPDVNFQKKLQEMDINVENGKIDNEAVKDITKLSLAGLNIESLDGLEAFANLKVLYCHDNKITSLD